MITETDKIIVIRAILLFGKCYNHYFVFIFYPSHDFLFYFASSLQQNLFHVILQACRSILLAKSLMQKYGMKRLEGDDNLITYCVVVVVCLFVCFCK